METLTLENDFLKLFAPYVQVAPEPPALLNEFQKVSEQLNELQTARGKMFQFEDKTEIDAKIRPFYLRRRDLLYAQEGYTEKLSPDAFKLRRQDGLPTFMVINLDERERIFGIRVTDPNSYNVVPWSLPDIIKNQFGDVSKLLYSKMRFWQSEITIHAELSGYMPDHVRPLVQKAKDAKVSGSKAFDKMFIIAEAPEWKFNQMPVIKTDPIVVGYDYWTQRLYLITVYDPTDLETYLAEQYTHS